MSFVDWVDPATGQDDPGTDSPAVQPEETAGADLDHATGGDTPGEQSPGPVPYDRFQEVVRARQEMEQQIGQYEPYSPLISALSQAGLSADQVLAYLTQQTVQSAAAPAQTPDAKEDARQAYFAELGLDPDYADPFQVQIAQRAFEADWRSQQLETSLKEYTDRQQRAEVETQQQQLETEFNALSAQIPALKQGGDHARRGTFERFAQMLEQNPHATLQQAAKAEADWWAERDRGLLAQYSAGKSADARAPVTAGGASPAVAAPSPDLFNMSRDERAQYLLERRQNLQGQA